VTVELPHFTLPFQWAPSPYGGVAAQVADQESVAEIGACCEAIIRTVQGQRTTLPTFGHPQLEFSTQPELIQTVLGQALLDGEPRVQSLVTEAPDPEDELIAVVTALIAPIDNEEGDQT
jgi:hypothetical protein